MIKRRKQSKENKVKVKKAFEASSFYHGIKIILFIAIIISLGLAVKPLFKGSPGASQGEDHDPDSHVGKKIEQDVYEEFLIEAFDKIKANYWETITDEQLVLLYKAAAEKVIELPLAIETNDKAGLLNMINEATKDMTEEKKKEFIVNAVQVAIVNLQPFGRSGLFTTKDEQVLRDTVANVDRSINLYDELDIDESSSQEEIKNAYEEKKESLDNIIADEASSEEAKKEAEGKKEQIDRAFETLANEAKRENYDEAGVESTVSYEFLRDDIFYIHLEKMSPTTFDEFQAATIEVDKGDELDTLILDLRANLGGAIDLMQWFLGPFIGLDQYAYEFYHRGEKEPFKTKIGWMPSLVRYKKVIVLIDGATQSSAEIMAATLKKYNVGVVVGTPTRGWGTVENTFPLDTKIDEQENYSLFLVHSVTLRDDGELIEGRGVDPHININSPDWQEQLYAYIPSDRVVSAVQEALEIEVGQ